ncbi:MAG: hypothetical protein Kow00105_03730 [Phycisphaeraceae bacterium]
MTSTEYAVKSAWEDRWVQPTLEQLLEPLDEQRRKVVDILIENIEAFPGVERRLIWHGTSWRWTIQFVVFGEDQKLIDTLVYLVPNPESPTVCVPLKPAEVEKLPLKRLNRYIRDGIRVAKRAVEVYWTNWTPTAVTETEHLMDLIKRRHKLLRPKPTAKSK